MPTKKNTQKNSKKPKPGKWITWKAKADSVCPVHPDTIVQIKLADNGPGRAYERAGDIIWDSIGVGEAIVIAYRIVKAAPKGPAKKPTVSRTLAADTSEMLRAENSTDVPSYREAHQEATPGVDFVIGGKYVMAENHPFSSYLLKGDVVTLMSGPHLGFYVVEDKDGFRLNVAYHHLSPLETPQSYTSNLTQPLPHKTQTLEYWKDAYQEQFKKNAALYQPRYVVFGMLLGGLIGWLWGKL